MEVLGGSFDQLNVFQGFRRGLVWWVYLNDLLTFWEILDGVADVAVVLQI